MKFPYELEPVEGAMKLHDWFGYWPSFHDAEVIDLRLTRTSDSLLSIHTWEITDKVDSKGFYVLTKHVVVEFVLKQIFGLNLTGFNFQNVISGLDVERIAEGFRLDLRPCYGIAGTIEAKEISINLFPGKPKDAHL